MLFYLKLSEIEHLCSKTTKKKKLCFLKMCRFRPQAVLLQQESLKYNKEHIFVWFFFAR